MTLLLDVEDGKLTIEQAMLDAGYTPVTARQQTNSLQNPRQNTAMQAALRKVGFTEDAIAAKIRQGLDITQNFVVKKGEEASLEAPRASTSSTSI